MSADEPTGFPQGGVIDHLVDDDGDALDAVEREALDAAILAAWHSVQQGRGSSAADVLARLRER